MMTVPVIQEIQQLKDKREGVEDELVCARAELDVETVNSKKSVKL